MIIFYILIAGGVFLIDELLKYSIEERFQINEERAICKGKVFVRRVHNKGACLNLFQTRPDKVRWTSLILSMLLTIYDAILLRNKGHFVGKTAMMLFTGGAFSNTYDRWSRGYVVDYIGFKTKWKKLTRITYNIGDFCIFAGALLKNVSN